MKNEQKSSLGLTLGIMALVAVAAIVCLVNPRWVGGDVFGPGTIQPALTTNIIAQQTVSYSNSVIIAPIPSGVIAYRRTLDVLSGTLLVLPFATNANAGTLSAITYAGGGLLTSNLGPIELSRTPYADASVVQGVANNGSTTACVLQYQITGLVVTNLGGSIPSGAAGALNIAVVQ